MPPIASVLTTLYLLPYLPEYVLVHFDIHGVPDRWDTLSGFLGATVPYMIGAQCITLVFILVELKVPMIFYLPRLPKEKLVNLMYDIGVMMAWILLLAYIDMLYYAVHGEHLVPAILAVALTVVVAIVIVVRISLLWVKWKKIVKE